MWRPHQIMFYFLSLLLFMFLVQGCDNTSMEHMEQEEGLTSQQICKLISDNEAKNLVGIPLHVNANTEGSGRNSSCIWLNDEDVPQLILDYHASVRGPVLSWLKAHIAEGYELFTVPGGHGGDIGVAYIKDDSVENATPGIFMVAVCRGEQLITLSAPSLNAEKGSKTYHAWLDLADNIAGRLGGGGDIRD